MEVSDVESALKKDRRFLGKTSPLESILEALMPLAHKIPQISVVANGEGFQIQKSDFSEISSLWEKTRVMVDATLKEIKSNKNAVINDL